MLSTSGFQVANNKKVGIKVGLFCKKVGKSRDFQSIKVGKVGLYSPFSKVDAKTNTDPYQIISMALSSVRKPVTSVLIRDSTTG
jgi:hypothetical protein